MRIFLRTFNNKINSKTGTPLPLGQYRGTKEWGQFEKILIDCLIELGHFVRDVPEQTNFVQDQLGYHKHMAVHQTKRELPNYDFFWMQSHMRELFTIDSSGWGADASNNNFKLGDVDEEEAKTFCESKSAELLRLGTSKCEQPKETSETPESFILVPLQIPRDYTIKHHSPVTVKYFIDSIMSWAKESQTHICIKMHPFNKVDTDLQEAVSEGERQSEFVHKVEGNIHALINRSRGLFVINSGTGFEAILHGRPVATFGNCDYNKVTFNADLRRLDEASNFLLSYGDVERDIAYQFCYWYWTKHAYDVNAVDTKERLLQYLKEKLV